MLTVTIPDDELFRRVQDLQGREVPGGTVMGPSAGFTADPLPAGTVQLVPWDVRSPLPEEVAAAVDVVVIGHYFVERGAFDVLRTLPALRLVQLPSAGFEHALPHLPPGVALANGRGVHSTGTAELTLGLIIAAQRGIVDAVRSADAGLWEPRLRPSLADRRVLVVGAGSVGDAIVSRLEAFETQVTVVARTAREQGGRHVHGVDELPALLPHADVVVLVTPLSRETYHLADAAFLAAMPDGALLVNVARGKVVDTDALLAELATGRLRAALDVTDPEPLPPGHPLWTAPGVLVTPHLGGNTDAVHPRVAALVRRQVEALLAGQEPVNLVART